MPDEPLGRRIIVTGGSGSGKTTLAAEMAERLGLAFIELDALFWLPEWTEPDADEFRAKVRRALAEAPDGWVVAGNYRSRTHDITWSAADMVIWLDLPLWRTASRILRRSWQRSRSRELLWGTNHERFWPQLKLWSPKDSLIGFGLRHNRAGNAWRRAEMSRPGAARWVRLRSPREVAEFRRGVAPAQ